MTSTRLYYEHFLKPQGIVASKVAEVYKESILKAEAFICVSEFLQTNFREFVNQDCLQLEDCSEYC